MGARSEAQASSGTKERMGSHSWLLKVVFIFDTLEQIYPAVNDWLLNHLLGQALQLDPSRREFASNSTDFEGLWYQPAFRRLFGYQ